MLPILHAATRHLFHSTAGYGGFAADPHIDATWSPTPLPLLNYVLEGAGDDAGATIDRVLAQADGRGFIWKVPPGEHALAEALEAHGFVPLPPSVPMSGPIPAEVEQIAAALPSFRRVRTARHYDRWLEPFAAAFGLIEPATGLLRAAAVERGFAPDDAIQHVFIEADGVSVASGTVVLLDPEIAGVFNLAVHPSARRRGYGTAVLAALAVVAHRAGRTVLGQFSTPDGVPLYQPFATTHAEPLRNYLWMGSCTP